MLTVAMIAVVIQLEGGKSERRECETRIVSDQKSVGRSSRGGLLQGGQGAVSQRSCGGFSPSRF